MSRKDGGEGVLIGEYLLLIIEKTNENGFFALAQEGLRGTGVRGVLIMLMGSGTNCLFNMLPMYYRLLAADL